MKEQGTRLFTRLKSSRYFYIASTVIILITVITIALLTVFRQPDQIKPINTGSNENATSYPVSYISNENKTHIEIPELPKRPSNHAQLSKEEVMGNESNSLGTPAIAAFYSALRDKDYREAFKYGSQGRSVDSIKSLYEGIDYITFEINSKLSDSEYIGQVYIRENENLSFYKVKWYINNTPNFQEATIISSEVIPYSGEVYIDCNIKGVEEENKCIVRDLESGDVLNLKEPQIYNPFISVGKNINRNEVGLPYFLGIAESIWTDVYKINLETNKLSYIDSYSWAINPIYLPSLKEEIGDCDYSLLASYTNDGCLLKYSEENWFRINLEYLSEVSKYSNQLHNF